MKKILLYILLFLAHNLSAQVDSTTQWLKESYFENKLEWLAKERTNNKDSLNFIKILTQATLLSFKDKKYISYDFVADVIDISQSYEFHFYLRTYNKVDNVQYPITLSFINELLNVQNIKDTKLRILLLEIQNKCIDSNKFRQYLDNREKNLLEIITLKEDAQEENSLEYYQQMLEYASLLTKKKKFEAAEKYYRYIEAPSRGLFLVVNRKYSDSYRRLFAESGRGIIDCRRGDKVKLKELNRYAFIGPNGLTEYYEKAMLEIGEKVDWDKD